jgi:hypothetical protein
MKKLASILAVALATLLVASCGTSNTTSYCPDLATDTVLPQPVFVPGGLWNVSYMVSATGGAPVNSFQYRDSTGILVTVTNPVLPWSYSMIGKAAGTRVTLSVSAIAPPGTVTADITAETGTAGSRETRNWTDTCGDLLTQ